MAKEIAKEGIEVVLFPMANLEMVYAQIFSFSQQSLPSALQTASQQSFTKSSVLECFLPILPQRQWHRGRSAAVSDFVKNNSKLERVDCSQRVAEPFTTYTDLLKFSFLNSWQRLFLEPLQAGGSLRTSRYSSWSGQVLRQKIWTFLKPLAKFILSLVEPRFYCHLITKSLGFQHYCIFFLSNFRHIISRLLTKIFMVNSNYSVVVVSWDLSCGPMCIIRSGVWMHNEETGLLFIYVWCSLPYPQTFTQMSSSWGINTKMWPWCLVRDVPHLQTVRNQ